MFEPKNNPNYEELLEDATEVIAGWLHNDWYASSSEDKPMIEFEATSDS
jgi:hypothetical protein